MDELHYSIVYESPEGEMVRERFSDPLALGERIWQLRQSGQRIVTAAELDCQGRLVRCILS